MSSTLSQYSDDEDGFSLEKCNYADSWSIYLYNEDVSIGPISKTIDRNGIKLLVRFWRKGVLHGEICGRLKAQLEMRKAMGLL